MKNTQNIHPIDKNAVKRICIVRPSALGDVARTVPVLVSLKKHCPDAEIDWIVQDTFVAAVAAHPDINEVIGFPRKHFARFGRNMKATTDFLDWTNNLKHKKYDTVYDCQGLARSALITWCTRSPKRVGFAKAREFASVAYTHKYSVDNSLHTVDQMLSLIEADGVTPIRDMRLYTTETDAQWWQNRRNEISMIENQPYAVIAPTSRWPAKRWPINRFAALIDPILERGFKTIIIIGAETERDQCIPVLEKCENVKIIDLVGSTTIGQLMAVIQAADLVIANDSAALHIAVGFNRRYLALYGPTAIDRVGPYPLDTSRKWIIQNISKDEKLNHKNTSASATEQMERISVQEVIRHIDQILSENPLECPKFNLSGHKQQ